MGNEIVINNVKNEISHSIGYRAGTGYLIENIPNDDEGFFVFPTMEHETELGVYTVQLIHCINSDTLKPMKIDFKPHSRKLQGEES